MKRALTPFQRRLHRAVRRLVKAEVADSWKGGGAPEYVPAVERELVAARLAYAAVLGELWKADLL